MMITKGTTPNHLTTNTSSLFIRREQRAWKGGVGMWISLEERFQLRFHFLVARLRLIEPPGVMHKLRDRCVAALLLLKCTE